MYIFLRLFWILWRGLRSPKALLLERVLELRVLPSDLDFNLHMNNGRYLTLMDLGRIDLVVRGGLLPHIRANKWYPVLGNCTIRFRRPLDPFQKFILRTRLVCWDDKWLYMTQSFEQADGKVAALALVRGLFNSPEGPVSPAKVMQAAGYTEPSAPVPVHYANWGEIDDQLWVEAGAR